MAKIFPSKIELTAALVFVEHLRDKDYSDLQYNVCTVFGGNI